MLKETISTYDSNNELIKLVCIDVLRKKGQNIPSQIKSVPALFKIPNKEIIFGKDVFDYLLLPGSGILLKQKEKNEEKKENELKENNTNDLISFTFGSNSRFSSDYASFDDIGDNVLQESANSWSSISDLPETTMSPESFLPLNEKTRSEKNEIDFDKLKIQRDLDIRQKDLSNLELAPPIKTRDS
jgi:hypothetical protein